MSVEFPNCLVSGSTGCRSNNRKWKADDEKFTGRQVNGARRYGCIYDDPTSCRRLDVNDFSDESRLPTRKSFDAVTPRDRSGAAAADSRSTPQRKFAMSFVSSGSLELELDRIQVQGRIGGRRYSVDDLTRLLERVKATFGSGPGVSVGLSPPESKSGGEASFHREMSSTRRLNQSRPLFVRSRKSLPDRLTDCHVTTARQEARKRSGGRRGGVKFADNFGLNLNTFVMIPSRHSAHAQPEVSLFGRRLSQGGGDYVSGSGDIFNRKSMLLLGLDCEDDRLVFRSDRNSTDETWKIWKKRNDDSITFSAQNPGFTTKKILRGKREADPMTTMTSQPEVDFRLCFEQPFADLEHFRCRLGANFLCLENVRVDDGASRSPTEDPVPSGSGPRSSSIQGSATILCSIKVRRSGHRESVFARCTDNDWTSYADLPGEYLPGVTNLGLDYDTFCFAVRRPVHRRRNGDPPPRKWQGTDVGRPPTSAVEFAVCAVVSTPRGNVSHWDNNNGSNYRIEWFD